jgi:hypothetical protein
MGLLYPHRSGPEPFRHAHCLVADVFCKICLWDLTADFSEESTYFYQTTRRQDPR